MDGYMTMVDWEQMLKDNNLSIYMRPDFPKVEFKYNGWNYKVTNMKYLNERALKTLEECIRTAGQIEDANEVTFEFDCEEWTVDELHIISDIVCGVDFEATKKGKNGGKIWGSFLVTSSEVETQGKNGHLKFNFNEDEAGYIFEFFKERGLDANSAIPFYEIVAYCAQKLREKMHDWSEEQ